MLTEELRSQLSRFASGVWRRRWQAVCCAWAICLVGWLAVSRLPDQYEVNARLYVDSDAVLTPLLKGIALDASVTSQIELLQRTLLSRPNLEKLVSKTSLEFRVTDPADLERVVTGLSNDIKLVPQTRNLFTISYRATDPRLAFDVVQAILAILIETKSSTSRSDLENARTFLDQQILLYETKLHEAEERRAVFKASYVDLLPDSNGGATRLDAAGEKLHRLQGELVDAIAKRDRLAKELTTTPTTVVVEVDPGTPASSGGGGGEAAAAERKLREMLLTSTDQHPDVQQQRRVVQMLRSGGGGGGGGGTAGRPPRTRSDVNPVYNQLRLSLIDVGAQVDSLQRQVTDAAQERERLEQIARSVPGVQAQYANLERDYDVVRKNYEELLSRRESMRVSAAADAGTEKVKLQVIDPAQVPHTPVGPRRVLMMSGVLIAGLAGGVAIGLLRVLLDQSFRSLSDLRVLGLPIAGGISLLTATVGRRRQALAVGQVAVALVLLCAVFGALVYKVALGSGQA